MAETITPTNTYIPMSFVFAMWWYYCNVPARDVQTDEKPKDKPLGRQKMQNCRHDYD